MTRIRAVLFDLDGTLVDQESASESAVVEWAAELSVTTSDLAERWRRISAHHYERYQRRDISFSEQRRERVRELLGSDLDSAAADRLFAGYLRRYEDGWSLFADAIPALERARGAGCRLGILTNGDREQQMQKVGRFSISAYVDEVVCSSELPAAKPDARAFQAAVERIGAEADETLMVGDHVDHDVRGAIAAGLPAVLVDRGRSLSDAGVPRVTSLDEVSFAL